MALSAKSEVHANHCEAHNARIRRRCSAYRRRQNHYSKHQVGLNRAITVLHLIHNWFASIPLYPKQPRQPWRLGSLTGQLSSRKCSPVEAFTTYTNLWPVPGLSLRENLGSKSSVQSIGDVVLEMEHSFWLSIYSLGIQDNDVGAIAFRIKH